MHEDRPLEGNVAVVTGGSRGIGQAISLRLAEAGAAVGIIYRSNHDAAAGLMAQLKQNGLTAILVPADVGDEQAVDEAFARIESQLGPVGVLVNNAGLHKSGRIVSLPLRDWRSVLDTNLTGTFLCCRRVVPGMLTRRSGRIVNVGSVVGMNGFPGDTAYAAAKAGLVGFTKALALEVARDGVAVNALIPGFVDTDMTRALEHNVLERIIRSIPAGRQATIDEIADVAMHLVTCPAYLTGTSFVVDGCWTIA
jgi:3-oxoacyl-[acyl-carrier protein] reductase